MIETICFNPLLIIHAIKFYTPIAVTVVKLSPFRVHQQEQGKEDFAATPPLSDVVLIAWGSQVIFDLTITATSLQHISREGQDVQGHPTSIFGKYLFERRFEI